MALQHSHSSTPIENKKNKIVVICDGVNGPANIGGLFRVCDAFGVEQLIFCGAQIDLTSNRLLRTARNTIQNVSHKVSENTTMEELKTLQNSEWTLVALELTKDSISLKDFSISHIVSSQNSESITESSTKPLVLIIGNERNGVSEEVLSSTHRNVHIPMRGANSSMNVVQAAAVALYALT